MFKTFWKGKNIKASMEFELVTYDISSLRSNPLRLAVTCRQQFWKKKTFMKLYFFFFYFDTKYVIIWRCPKP